MIIPSNLLPGDKIALVCTARKITLNEIEGAVKIISSWGYDIRLGKTIGLSDRQFAGTDTQRSEDLQKFLDDPDIKAIIACRGGYGTVRLLDMLDFRHFSKRPKWIIGYSDLTVLHNHINNTLKITSLHATMPINFSDNTCASLESLKNALSGKTLHYTLRTHPLNREGSAVAPLTGGNLSLIYSMLGTSTDVVTEGRILFLEDLDEYLYHVDRMMMSLKRAGKLKGLKGLIVGSMTKMNDNQTPFGKTAEEIISEHVAEYSYPVCFNFPAGHIDNNMTIMMGGEALFKVSHDKVAFSQSF